MLTITQITAIIQLLLAFGAPQTDVSNVQTILLADAAPSSIVQTIPVQVAPTQAAPTQQSAPVAPTFGSVQPTQATQSIVLHVGSTSPEIGTGMSQISATAYVNGIYTKMPIIVTTNDPDLPSQFIINQLGQVNYFCVAPTYPDFPNHGCQNENPATAGIFSFQFGTDQGVLASTTITVLP